MFFLYRVPIWQAMTLSEELAGIATNTPEKLGLTENIVALTRFRAPSDEGLSDDLCAPTYTTGMERFCKAKLRQLPCVSAPCEMTIP